MEHDQLLGIRHWHRHRDTFIRSERTVSTSDIEDNDIAHSHQDKKTDDATILRLPPETMVEIFKFSQVLTYYHGDKGVKHWDWCWITVTHVCKYWRNVAIAAQDIWTFINCKMHATPEQTNVYLERSGSSPLCVHIHYDLLEPTGYALDCLKLVASHLHRVRALHIQTHSYPGPKVLLELIRGPAPQLEVFSLENYSNTGVDMQRLFTEEASKLTSLSINFRPLSWKNVSLMRNIKKLHISNQISIEELFCIVSQIQNCEQLLISSLLDLGLGDSLDFPRTSHIIQSSLKRLRISKAKYNVLSLLFETVYFPSLIDWDVVCTDFPYKNSENVEPKSVIPRTSYNNKGVRSLKLFISAELVKITVSYPKAAVADIPDVHQTVTSSWESFHGFGEHATHSNGFTFVSSVIKGELWCYTNELVIDVCSSYNKDLSLLGVDDDDWKLLLKLLPHVSKITVSHVYETLSITMTDPDTLPIVDTEAHHGFLSALGSPIENNEDRDVLCPRLTELHFRGFDVSNRDSVRRALEPLKYRKECGYELSLLRVTHVPRYKSTDEILQFLEESGVAQIVEAGY